MADDELMAMWIATQGTSVCTCLLCRNLAIEELVHDYDWQFAERSLERPDWMIDQDGMAPLYMKRQQALRDLEEAEIRSKLWLTRKGWFRRLWERWRHG